MLHVLCKTGLKEVLRVQCNELSILMRSSLIVWRQHPVVGNNYMVIFKFGTINDKQVLKIKLADYFILMLIMLELLCLS